MQWHSDSDIDIYNYSCDRGVDYLNLSTMNDDMAMAMPLPLSLEQVVVNSPTPQALEEWRNKLFMVDGTLELSEEQ